MDLKNMTPKDKQMYEIALENINGMLLDFKETEELPEAIRFIRRAEYKRGKADGIKETSSD